MKRVELEQITVADIMDCSVCWLPPTASLTEARRMLERGLSHVLVTVDDRPVGVLTERDLLALLPHPANDQADATALQAVIRPVTPTIHQQASLAQVLALMAEQQNQQLFVVDDLGRLLGVVSQQQLLKQVSVYLMDEHAVGAQEKLEQSQQLAEQHWHLAAEVAKLGFWELTIPGGLLHFYDEHAPGREQGGHQLTLEHWLHNVHPDDKERVMAGYRGVLQTDDAMIDVQYRLRHGHGWSWRHSRGRVARRDSAGQPLLAVGITTDINEFKQMEARNEIERRMLRMLTKAEPLTAILTELAVGYERLFPGMLSSILLLDQDGRCLRHGVAPSLPPAYCQAIDGAAIGAKVGSCGSAAYSKRAVIVGDIATHPNWRDYKDLALAHGLRACWSVPIISAQDRVLGTFALYYPAPRNPLPEEVAAIEQGAYLASLAIDHIGTETSLRHSEARFRKLVEKIPIPLLYVAKNGRINYMNDSFVQIFGYGADDLRSLEQWWRLAYPNQSHRQSVMTAWDSAFLGDVGKVMAPIESKVTCKNGQVRVMEIAGVAFDDTYLATFIDLTAHRQAEDEMRKLSQALEQTSSPVVITDLDARIEYVNTAFVEQTGYNPEELIGANLSILQSGKTPENTYQDMWTHLQRGEGWQGEFINKRKDGSEYVEAVRISPMRQADSKISHYLGIQEDVTERKRYEERIHYLAHFDALTGLPNRACLQDSAYHLINKKPLGREPLALLYFDLDHFKDINDSFGHSMGDVLLIEMAARLKAMLREGDIVSRQGGDEFILLLPSTDARGAAQVAKKLLSTITKPFLVGKFDLQVTASIGIAVYPGDGPDFETLCKNADTAMYRIKHQGRNGYCFFAHEQQ